MWIPEILCCPGTLAEGYSGYSKTCLNRVFNGRKVNHILPYFSPLATPEAEEVFNEHRKRISISGVQEKVSVVLDKNKLRFANETEHGTHILKTIPLHGKRKDQMPANEHLTMQIARQIFLIETAENALIFFADGAPAYLTKRFDVNSSGEKLAQEDLASLCKKTPQTHGTYYKYTGNYLEIFLQLRLYLSTYKTEAPKLFKLLIFNYLFSNGDAHLKNFSIIETPQGDYKLSPAYDLLNTAIHINDSNFALEGGLLPANLTKGKISSQFRLLAELSEINQIIVDEIMALMLSGPDLVEKMIRSSYLNESTKRNYWQAYNNRLKQIAKT